MVSAKYNKKMYGHIIFDVDKNYYRLGKGLLDHDGHGTFSPDGKWMVTDTYPKNEMNEQKIFLMDMNSEAVISLGRFQNNINYKKIGDVIYIVVGAPRVKLLVLIQHMMTIIKFKL